MQRFQRRPSPALVVATFALVVASAGTASGAVAFIAKLAGLNHKQKGQVTSIADAQIAAKAPTLSVLSATNATNAANATTAANANALGGASLASLNLGASTVSGVTSSSCDPSTTSFVDCGTVSLNLPR
jgi:hypothetical protein